jgi:hypothetical protein
MDQNGHIVAVVNYGNESIALLQCLWEAGYKSVQAVSVETGWAGVGWAARISHAREWVSTLGFQTVHLKAHPDFEALVRARHEFPTPQFQWCASLMKGLPILEWLDEWDPELRATVVLGLMAVHSPLFVGAPHTQMDQTVYGGRVLHCPLMDCDLETERALIGRSGLSYLPHRSLECDPCIHSCLADLARLDPIDILKTEALETALGESFLELSALGSDQRIAVLSAHSQQLMQTLGSDGQDTQRLGCGFSGCGRSYGCGT